LESYLNNGEFMEKILVILLMSLVLLAGCGGGESNNTNSSEPQNENEPSNISYLKTYHTNYSDINSAKVPLPIKDNEALSVQWYISANTTEDAIKLYEHISFMNQKLIDGENPRGWDKLFLLEAYMKTAHRYSTFVSIENDTNVLITKTATDHCAYDIIAAHSDVVSHDFFGQGIINMDYSTTAENIMNSNHCSLSKPEMEAYITARIKPRGTGNN
jgi:hypothetical protein